jgi:hypothetical protein
MLDYLTPVMKHVRYARYLAGILSVGLSEPPIHLTLKMNPNIEKKSLGHNVIESGAHFDTFLLEAPTSREACSRAS